MLIHSGSPERHTNVINLHYIWLFGILTIDLGPPALTQTITAISVNYYLGKGPITIRLLL